MPTETVSLNTLLNWSPAKRVRTAKGEKDLRTAAPTEKFWQLWRSDKASLQAAGISVGKSQQTGQWEACWWQNPPVEEMVARAESREQSRSTGTETAIDIPVPDGLAYLPYQRAGIAYASARAACLIGDEMGLGKTVQAIGVSNMDATVKSVLIVCPASLKITWQREWQKWDVKGLSVGIANGSFPNTDVVIINYDLLVKYRPAIDARQWDLLIADEVHMAKNPKAQRTKALFGDKEKPAIQAKRRVFLSGTPILNRPCELYTLVKALDPNGLGKSWSGYHVRYCAAVQTRFGWDVSGASHLDELQNRLRETFMVRRLKSDVLKELPAKTRQVVSLPVTPSMAALLKREGAAYDEWQEAQEAIDALNELGEDYADDVRRLRVEMETAFTEMSALRHEVALAKVPAVLEQVAGSLEGGANKIILFAHHLDVIDALMEGLDAYNPVKVTGSMSGPQRQASVDAFQNDANCRVFVGNIRAAGVGLTLTAASLVAFAELDWVPGNLCQAEDRAHRIGQTDNVLVQHLVFDGSLDAIMAKTLISKQSVIDRALDTPTQAPIWEHQAEEITVKEIEVQKLQEAIREVSELTGIDHPELTPRIHSEETIKVVQDAVRYMTGMDSDHCQENNGIGWNGGDSKPGHWLASLPTLNDKQVTLAIRMLRKYAKTQLKGFGKNMPWS